MLAECLEKQVYLKTNMGNVPIEHFTMFKLNTLYTAFSLTIDVLE